MGGAEFSEARMVPLGGRRGGVSEKELWAAVLVLGFKDAIGELMRKLPEKSENKLTYLKNRRRIIEEARTWVNSNRKTLGSYIWVCDVLEVDPSIIRAKVNKVIPSYY
jgi:hypothetical protein